MKWKYHVAHDWESPSQRSAWEDVYLMPDEPGFKGDSVWFSVYAADLEDPKANLSAEGRARLAADGYWVDGTDLVVRGRDLARDEIVKWAELWLKQNGFAVDGLVEGTLDDFQGTNEHAKMIDLLRTTLGEE
jgi:hypothetical protein